VPAGKGWLQRVMPGPGGTTRGRPREEVEWMRRVSLMMLWRLVGWSVGRNMGGGRGKNVLG